MDVTLCKRNAYCKVATIKGINVLPWWLIVLIMLSFGLVEPQVFQLAVKLVKTFEGNVSQIRKLKRMNHDQDKRTVISSQEDQM